MYHINLIDRYTDFTDLEFTKNVIMWKSVITQCNREQRAAEAVIAAMMRP